MVVPADKLSCSLAGGIGHVLYMHLQNSKLLLKGGEETLSDLLVGLLLGCIVTGQMHLCAAACGSMENPRLTSLWKHLTS